MSRLFGTDGVRGVANRELTAELAYRLGYAGARVLAQACPELKPCILVATDTRRSKDMLKAALMAGVCAAGADAWDLGVLPTPAIAYLTAHYQAAAGAVISASHNPYEYNGIKFINAQGFKLADEIEDAIEAELTLPEGSARLWGQALGSIEVHSEAAEIYLQHLQTVFPLDLRGLRLGLDCANGAAARLAPRLFTSLGAEISCIGIEPDGCNINAACGSTHLEALQALVQREQLDFGLAFDGDADRMLAVTAEGQILDGDQVMALLAVDLKARGVLSDDTVVTTVMSNLGLDLFAAEHGFKLRKTKVGDRYVLEDMLTGSYRLGGEQSGHLILLDYATTGDGMLSGLCLLRALQASGLTFSEAANQMKKLPQVLVNVQIPNEQKAAALAEPDFQKACLAAESLLAGRGRVLVRPSGTEPLVRVMLEGEDLSQIQSLADSLAAQLRDFGGIQA